VSWIEQGERLWASVIRAADAVAGPPPRRRDAPSRPPRLAAGQLGVRAALWGIALGLLAPATTVLVQVSGLAADDVQLVGSTDVGFFFGFVPLLTALVVTLLALDHWPLRDLRAYHRELAVVLLLVGAVTLVGLRAHGAAVTGDGWDRDWLFANGSLVLHLLVTWCLVRAATNDLTSLHARHAGDPGRIDPGGAPAVAAGPPPTPPTPPGTTRTGAVVALAFQALVWGVVVGTAAGAAAGTAVLPGLGTLAGGYLGAIYGLVPTAIGTAAIVVVVTWHRDISPDDAGRAIQATLALVGAVVLMAAWPLLHAADLPSAAALTGPDDRQRAWLLGAVVVVLLLRRAATHLAATYVPLVPAAAAPQPADT